MFEQPKSRKALYERIRQSSKDEVILEEMVRLGFWPAQSELPQDPAEDIRRKGQLGKRLSELRMQQAGLRNEAQLKEEARKKRMAEARARRLENRERRLLERQDRAAAWSLRKLNEIGFLGDGVSAGLQNQTADEARLTAQGLPLFADAKALASSMFITVPALRFLAYSRSTSKISHYQRFTIPKKTGGVRVISAPMPRLKEAQHWILRHILSGLPLHDAAHGFRPGRSIVSNAKPHVGSDVVVNIDLQNFFPTVSYRRVKGLFAKLGYSEEIATILGLLCTEPDISDVQLDGEVYHVATSERFLPQGAPTSPAISNLLCRRLDARMSGVCRSLGFTYTRYADDLSFSGNADAAKKVGKLLKQVEWLVAEEGFNIHPDKTRVFRRGSRQEVTGLVVNESLAVPRETLRRFRSMLFQIDRDGPDGKHWGAGNDVLASAMGFANFVSMVQPEKGTLLKAQVAALMDKHGGGSPPPPPPQKPDSDPDPEPSTEPESKSATESGLSTEPEPEPSTEPEAEQETPKPKKKKWWQIL